MNLLISIPNEASMERLGQVLAQSLPGACIVLLEGTLGAGKTRLVRAFAMACGVASTDVTSPTFTLWQTYGGNRTIHHLDAYRIQDEDEFEALGVAEAFDEDDAVVFVEWASRVENCLPGDRTLSIRIEIEDETKRTVQLSTEDPEIAAAIKAIDQNAFR